MTWSHTEDRAAGFSFERRCMCGVCAVFAFLGLTPYYLRTSRERACVCVCVRVPGELYLMHF